MMARVISVITANYAEWLLNMIAEGREKFDFWAAFKRFCRWLLTWLAQPTHREHRRFLDQLRSDR